MKMTDYGRIAPVYDQNDDRMHIPVDPTLKRCLEENASDRRVLDLACGTGSYLAVQKNHLGRTGVRWHGLDRSPDMLAVAKEKLVGVELIQGTAEQLPYGDGSMDYVCCRFAFHHFQGKEDALDQVARVLKEAGTLKLTNILPDLMRQWWVYQYFPETWSEDQVRFWGHKKIYEALTERGFRVRLDGDYKLRAKRLARLLEDAERRDISQLAIISDHAYAEGLERIKRELSTDPDRTVLSEFTFLELVAVKANRS